MLALSEALATTEEEEEKSSEEDSSSEDSSSEDSSSEGETSESVNSLDPRHQAGPLVRFFKPADGRNQPALDLDPILESELSTGSLESTDSDRAVSDPDLSGNESAELEKEPSILWGIFTNRTNIRLRRTSSAGGLGTHGNYAKSSF